MVCYAPAFQVALCSDVTLDPKRRSHEWVHHHAFFVFVLLYGNLGSEGKTDNRNRHVTNITIINAAMLELCMWRHGANTALELQCVLQRFCLHTALSKDGTLQSCFARNRSSEKTLQELQPLAQVSRHTMPPLPFQQTAQSHSYIEDECNK